MTISKHTLICIMLSGQYFSTSASNNTTGLQLCLWGEKVQLISLVMKLCEDEYPKNKKINKKRILFSLTISGTVL